MRRETPFGMNAPGDAMRQEFTSSSMVRENLWFVEKKSRATKLKSLLHRKNAEKLLQIKSN